MPRAIARPKVALLLVLGLLTGLLGMHALGTHGFASSDAGAHASHSVSQPEAGSLGLTERPPIPDAGSPASAPDCSSCASGHSVMAACILALLAVLLVLLPPTAWGRAQAHFSQFARVWPSLPRPGPPSLLVLCISRR